MKIQKFLLPIAIFSAFSFATIAIVSCDEEKTESGCEATDADEDDACDISDVVYCYDEDDPDGGYFTYKGKKYTDLDALTADVCDGDATATTIDKSKIRSKLSAQAKSLMIRIRTRAL